MESRDNNIFIMRDITNRYAKMLLGQNPSGDYVTLTILTSSIWMYSVYIILPNAIIIFGKGTKGLYLYHDTLKLPYLKGHIILGIRSTYKVKDSAPT